MNVFLYYDQMLPIALRTIATLLLVVYVEARIVPGFAHNVEIPPSFLTMPPKEIIHIPGRPLHIPCTATGSPEPRYEWYNNGQLLSIGTYADTDFYVPKSGTEQYAKSGSEGPRSSKSLLWDFSRLLNSGRLKPGWINCVAANPKGKALLPPTQLRIAELGGSGFCEPQTLTHRNEKFFRLNCSVPRSTPPAKIRWMFRREDGHIGFINENRTFSMDDSGNLYVSVNSLPASSGLTVFCSASNEILRTMRTGCDYLLPGGTASTVSPSPLLMYRSASRQVALFNSTVELRCLISPRKDTIIAWNWSSDVYSAIFFHKEGKWVSKDSKSFVPNVQIQLRAENTVLFIPRVTFDHSGTFTCHLQSSASFSTTPISADFKLLVESEPFFDEAPTDLTLPIGGSGRLNCFPSSLVLPKPEVTWYANGDRIEKFLDGKRKRLSGNTLVFSHVTIRDTAVFQCNISNRNGFAFANAYLNVWDSQPAIVEGPPEQTVCVEKQDLTLSCRTVGAPRAVVIWSKDGNLQLGSNRNTSERKFSRFTVHADGNLLISSVERSDSGMYTCVASNMFGQSTVSGEVLVRRQSRVTKGPVISGPKSQFKTSKAGRINTTWIDAGSAVSLSCRGETDVMEFDSLAIKWTRHRINTDCMAVLRLQSEVLYDERFCETDGPPVEISETSRRKLGQSTIESSITLQNLQPHDTGYYRCTAFNKLDNDSATAALIVQGPPEPPTAIKLDCKHEPATQTALLVWEPGSDNNAPITDISLEYIHGAYRPLNVKQREAPGVATAKVIEDLQSALLNEAWQPMKHMLVNFEPDFFTFSSGQALVNLTAHTATMTLHPDVAYQFRLRLINAAGRSGPSSVVPGFENEMGSTCIFPPQPPSSQPGDVVIYGNKPNNLVISWEIIPPLRHGGPGLQYHVTLRCLDCDYEFPAYSKTDNVSLNWKENKVIFSADTTSHTAVVHKLYPIEIFKKYEIRITTSNLVGFSQAPPVILTGWSAEAQPMLAPKNLRVANIEAASVDVLWDWPSVDDIAKQINGFFVGFRISWCPADKPYTICERYKVTQDVICAHPTAELFPEMRISSENKDRLLRKELGGWLKRTSNVQSSHTTTVRLNNNPFYHLRSATVTDLPGDTNIRLWICLLNIQYSGPKSEVIYVRTKEGVPGPVAEFIHSFSGVNYVEVTWSKPTQLNGILTGYIIDVISGNREKPNALENELRENWNIMPFYQRQINDSDQMAARISGLEMNSAYKLIIRAKTSSGAGKPRELVVHTAKSRSATSPAEFTVSPIRGSSTTLNVSLVTSTIGTLNDDNGTPDNGSHHMQAPNSHSYILDSSYPAASGLEDTIGSQGSKESSPNRGNLRHADGYFSPKPAVKSIQAFVVQFKRPVDHTWEETEREYERSWLVVRNLIPGQEYDMRIIVAKTPALSFVSPVRILRVPRPGEIGLGLLNAETERKSELGGGGGGGGRTSEGTFSLFGSSVAFQVLLPLISLLCLLLITTAGVCCWRNYGQRQPWGTRQPHFSAVDSSCTSPTRLSLREIHVAQKLQRGTHGRKDKRAVDVEKGLVRFQNSFTDSHNHASVSEYSKQNYSADDDDEEEQQQCTQMKTPQTSTSMFRHSSGDRKECILKETVMHLPSSDVFQQMSYSTSAFVDDLPNRCQKFGSNDYL